MMKTVNILLCVAGASAVRSSQPLRDGPRETGDNGLDASLQLENETETNTKDDGISAPFEISETKVVVSSDDLFKNYIATISNVAVDVFLAGHANYSPQELEAVCSLFSYRIYPDFDTWSEEHPDVVVSALTEDQIKQMRTAHVNLASVIQTTFAKMNQQSQWVKENFRVLREMRILSKTRMGISDFVS